MTDHKTTVNLIINNPTAAARKLILLFLAAVKRTIKYRAYSIKYLFLINFSAFSIFISRALRILLYLILKSSVLIIRPNINPRKTSNDPATSDEMIGNSEIK